MFSRIVSLVREEFKTREYLQVEVVSGFDARNAQDNMGSGGANRVAFVPPSGEGQFMPALHIGEGDDDENGEARAAMLVLPYVFDVCIAGYDADKPNDDVAHQHRCIDLFEVVAQVVRLKAGEAYWTGFSFDGKRKQGRFGAEFIATLEMRIPIFDAPWRVKTVSAELANPEDKQ